MRISDSVSLIEIELQKLDRELTGSRMTKEHVDDIHQRFNLIERKIGVLRALLDMSKQPNEEQILNG